LREIKLLQETNHENLIKLYDVFYVQKTIFLVLEYTPYDLNATFIRTHPTAP
jgi:serine/threonine protein kinase